MTLEEFWSNRTYWRDAAAGKASFDPSEIRAAVDAAWADARAGMVPEGELRPGLDALKAIHASRHAEILNLKAQLERLEASYGQHEAELAKAWEAAASAQREADKDTLFDNDYREATWFIDKHPLVQPPGGKATVKELRQALHDRAPRADALNEELKQDFAPPEMICGVACLCGPTGEPLACGYIPRHDGGHSWSTLPTFQPPGGKAK